MYTPSLAAPLAEIHLWLSAETTKRELGRLLLYEKKMTNILRAIIKEQFINSKLEHI